MSSIARKIQNRLARETVNRIIKSPAVTKTGKGKRYRVQRIQKFTAATHCGELLEKADKTRQLELIRNMSGKVIRETFRQELGSLG